MILCERVGEVAVLTLNRPERHNSLVPEMLEQMLVALDGIAECSSTRALVLVANGRSFSTGGDLQGFVDQWESLEAYASKIVGLLNRVILALVELPCPVVAAVHGIVTGGSLGLILGADLVLVSPAASFTPYYSVVGFSPDGAWTAILPSIIGPKRVAEILYCNRTITAQDAVAWGLASRIVLAEEILQEALSTARKLAAGAAGTLRHAKDLLNAPTGDLAERSRFVQQVGTEEAREGMRAFASRR